MFRTRDIILIAAMIGGAAATYAVKNRAENTLADIRDIERQIGAEENAIDLLRADWSLLTQPARLQGLTETYAEQLELQHLDPNQIGTIDQIARRPLSIDDIIDGEPGGAFAEQDLPADPVQTGGVEP